MIIRQTEREESNFFATSVHVLRFDCFNTPPEKHLYNSDINWFPLASNCLQVKELFQSRMTRTGSLAPSARQQRSRKSRQSPFEFFKKLKGGKSKTVRVAFIYSYDIALVSDVLDYDRMKGKIV